MVNLKRYLELLFQCCVTSIYMSKHIETGKEVFFNTGKCEKMNIKLISLLYIVPLQVDALFVSFH